MNGISIEILETFFAREDFWKILIRQIFSIWIMLENDSKNISFIFYIWDDRITCCRTESVALITDAVFVINKNPRRNVSDVKEKQPLDT